MKQIFIITLASIIVLSCDEEHDIPNSVITKGQMPNLTKDKSGNIHLVYGNKDSILYSYSSDAGKFFSAPTLISVLPNLAASHMRGPQIAATSTGLVVTVSNNAGDIFSFVKEGRNGWSQTARVNDVDTVAKEGLMALASDGDNAFAVWLDLRDGHNKIFGARSNDAGKTWSKNLLIYASPDSTVCECCKPSVAMSGNNVYVMFRNWLKGNRDLYIVQSSDNGSSFGTAQKIGSGSWALEGCPMDGGGIVINANGPETVFNRDGVIYACEPGKQEEPLGKGRNCAMETVNGKNVYAWVNGKNVTVINSKGATTNLGRGQLPILKSVGDNRLICVWENEKKIHSAIVDL